MNETQIQKATKLEEEHIRRNQSLAAKARNETLEKLRDARAWGEREEMIAQAEKLARLPFVVVERVIN